jgi:hypothetical protein
LIMSQVLWPIELRADVAIILHAVCSQSKIRTYDPFGISEVL